MKTRTITKAIALALAVSGCAIFTLHGLTTTASADDSVYADTALVSSATRSGSTASSGSALLDDGELFTTRDLADRGSERGPDHHGERRAADHHQQRGRLCPPGERPKRHGPRGGG